MSVSACVQQRSVQNTVALHMSDCGSEWRAEMAAWGRSSDPLAAQRNKSHCIRQTDREFLMARHCGFALRSHHFRFCPLPLCTYFLLFFFSVLFSFIPPQRTGFSFSNPRPWNNIEIQSKQFDLLIVQILKLLPLCSNIFVHFFKAMIFKFQSCFYQ